MNDPDAIIFFLNMYDPNVLIFSYPFNHYVVLEIQGVHIQ